MTIIETIKWVWQGRDLALSTENSEGISGTRMNRKTERVVDLKLLYNY